MQSPLVANPPSAEVADPPTLPSDGIDRRPPPSQGGPRGGCELFYFHHGFLERRCVFDRFCTSRSTE